MSERRKVNDINEEELLNIPKKKKFEISLAKWKYCRVSGKKEGRS